MAERRVIAGRTGRVRLRALPGRIVLYAVLLFLALSFLLPIIWMVSTSLQTSRQVYTVPPSLLPNPVRWQNYAEAIHFRPWGLYVYNTLIRYALPSVVGTLLSSSLVAYGFSRIRWRGREAVFFVCISTMMIPYPVTMVPLFIVYKELGWINTYLPLVVSAYFGYPYFIFLLRQFFLGIPIELSDAARIDGCSELGILVRVILPLAKPALAVVALFQFLAVWHDYLGPLIYLSREDLKVVGLGLRGMWEMLFAVGSAPENGFAYLMAIAALFSIPIIVIFFLAQRTFIEGVAVTGLKV